MSVHANEQVVVGLTWAHRNPENKIEPGTRLRGNEDRRCTAK